ncbi:hypothetical protein ACFVH7_11775 [Kitasatospora indigofera]|uniref:hypothetical protein n=1 Tax=Kitasatospora indigofera TaxID=67307 RepID=UPI0036309BB0
MNSDDDGAASDLANVLEDFVQRVAVPGAGSGQRAAGSGQRGNDRRRAQYRAAHRPDAS